MKKVMVIGAGFFQTPVIKRAQDLGYETIAVDMDKSAEGFKYSDSHRVINIVDKDACLDYAKEMQIDGVMTAATDYGVLTASYIAQELGLPGLNYCVAKVVKDKFLTRKKISELKIDDIEQFYEINMISDIEQAGRNFRYPVMVKPSDGSGSKAVARVNNYEGLKSACQVALDAARNHKAIVESFITGLEYGVESFVLDGHIFVLGIIKKYMTEPPFYAELGHTMPSGLPTDLEKRIIEVVTVAISVLEINFGAVNMDVLLTKDERICIIDVGARMCGNLIGSHIIPLGTGIDYMGIIVKSSVGVKVELTPNVPTSIVTTRLLALTPGKVVKLPDFEEIKQQCEVEIYHHLHVEDTIREYHNNLDGCGYVVAIADNLEEANSRAEKAKQLVDHGIVRNSV